LIFWWGHCDAPHQRLELGAIGGADAVGFCLIDKLRKPPAGQSLS